MTFATEKEKTESNRFMLVRIEPGRCINTLLTSIGGGVYSITLTGMFFNRVQRNGVNLAVTNQDPPTTNDQYNYNSTTNVLKIKLAAAPSSTNIIVVFHYLFYTGEKTRYASHNPGASGTMTEWSPHLMSYPNLSYTIDNITSGIMTIADTSFTFYDADSRIKNNLTINDSFYNKSFLVWICINSVSNMIKRYTGKVKSISFNGKKFTFSVYDAFTTLQKTALMGDSLDAAYFYRSATSFPSMRSEDHGTPCRYVLGRSKLIASNNYYGGFGIFHPLRYPLEGIRCISTVYTNSISTSNNRRWGLCRTGTNGVETMPVGTLVRWSDGLSAVGIKMFYFTGTTFRVGQTVRITISSVTHYGIIRGAEDFVWGGDGNLYNMFVEMLTVPYPAGFNSFTWDKDIQVFYTRSGTTYSPVLFRDYTLYEVATAAGNKYIYIHFANNFEANNSDLLGNNYGSAIDPDNDTLYFALATVDGKTHAGALSNLVTKSGLTPNAASFTAADAALPANISMVMPSYNDRNYPDYRSECQKIISSTLGYLRVNASEEIEYNLISAPSSTADIDDDIYLGDVSGTVDYSDIAVEVSAENPDVTDEMILDSAQSTVQVAASNLAKYLHETENVYKLDHVLTRYDNRIAALLSIKSNRRTTYRLSTSTNNIDSLIGDDINLISDKVTGSASSDMAKITDISITGSKTEITCDDLGGL